LIDVISLQSLFYDGKEQENTEKEMTVKEENTVFSPRNFAVAKVRSRRG